MKKLLALLLVLALIFSCLTACSKKEDSQTDEEEDREEVEEKAEEPEEESVEEETSEESADDVSEEEDAEASEKDGIDLGDVIGAISDFADSDIGSLIGELAALGVSEYIGAAALDISGDITIGTLDQLLAVGFTSEMDSETVLPAGEISEEFPIALGESEMTVRVANPKEEDIPLGSGIICYYRVDSDQMGTVGGFLCGVTSREDVLTRLGVPYDSDKTSLTYHTTALGTVDWTAIAEKLGVSELEDDFNRTLIFVFEEDVLASIIMEAPHYLYGGLADNVDEEDLDELGEMSAAELQKISEIRDSILNRLMQELTARGIDASINVHTGEVTLDNNVLFAHDAADLTEDGKAYLDQLFAAYAAVVLDEEYRDSINSILIEGHASPQGTHEYNLDLSQRRADNVLNYCLESTENGLTEEEKSELGTLMESRGLSFTDPVFDENGEVDFDASRRVSIKFCITIDG